MRSGCRLLAIACLTWFGVNTSALGSSTTLQINPAHNGNASFAGGFSPPLKMLWSQDLGAAAAYPVIIDNRLFINSGPLLYALNLDNGQVIWRKLTGGGNIAVDEGKIFVVNANGVVQAYNAANGETLWAERFPYNKYFQFFSEAPPVGVNGHLYVTGSSYGATLYSFAEASGQMEWAHFFSGGGGDGSPAFGDGGLYLTYPCDYYKFDPSNGNEIWHDQGDCEGGGGATPVYYLDRLYVRDANGDSILDSRTGQTLGTFTSVVPPAIFSQSEKSYLLAVNSGKLTCADSSTGAVLWTFNGDGKLSSAPIVINNVVVQGSLNGNLYVLDRLTGALLWSTQLGAAITQPDEAFPTGFGAGGNRVLVVPATNLLYAFMPAQ